MYTANNPVNATDATGLEWKIIRKSSSPFAVAERDSDADTVEQLAEKIGFDAMQFPDWLKDEDLKWVVSKEQMKGKLKFSVPNEIVVLPGNVDSSDPHIGQEGTAAKVAWFLGNVLVDSIYAMERSQRTGINIATRDLKGRGFYVDTPSWTRERSDALDNIKRRATVGTLHGILINAHGTQDLTLFNDKTSSSGTRDISSGNIRDLGIYKFGYLAIMACGTTDITWFTIMGASGEAWAYEGKATPAAYDSLVRFKEVPMEGTPGYKTVIWDSDKKEWRPRDPDFLKNQK